MPRPGPQINAERRTRVSACELDGRLVQRQVRDVYEQQVGECETGQLAAQRP
jgi:hypothetical protein